MYVDTELLLVAKYVCSSVSYSRLYFLVVLKKAWPNMSNREMVITCFNWNGKEIKISVMMVAFGLTNLLLSEEE